MSGVINPEEMSNMSYMEKLLNEVEVAWKPVLEVFHLRNGYTPSRSKKEYWEDGTVPWFRMDDIRESGQILDDSLQKISASAVKGGKLFPADSIIMATSATIGEHALIKTPYLANQRFTNLSVKTQFAKLLDSKFLFYYCFVLADWCRRNTTKSNFASVEMDGFKKFEFPIPCPENPKKSLAIQAEIVRILDTFTELTNELTNELKARQKQYNYYRDQLLSFEDGDVEWKPIGEIGEFIRGKRFTKKDYVDDGGVPVIHYGEIYTRYGTSAAQAHSQVRSDLAKSLRYAEPGDVVFTDVGETVEDVGKAMAWIGEGRAAIHDHCYALRHSMNPKFVAYCMQTSSFIANKAKHVARTKVKTLLVNGFAKTSIPVPYPGDPEKSLEEQARIVSILDKFEAITTSLTVGLPREIELRQKQYEYYRDLLLSFPKPEDVAA